MNEFLRACILDSDVCLRVCYFDNRHIECIEPERGLSMDELKLNGVGAFSWLNTRPLADCLRPKQVECFSIRQNLWVSRPHWHFRALGVLLARIYNGSLNIGDSTKLLLNAYRLEITPAETPFQTAMPTILFIIGSTSWVFRVIAVLLILRRRRQEE